LEDSSSFDDSNLEELLDNDVEQTTVILVKKEILDVRPKKRKGSTMGWVCIPPEPRSWARFAHAGKNRGIPRNRPLKASSGGGRVNEVGYTIKYHMHGACLLNLSE
jgi:hypothetical protein